METIDYFNSCEECDSLNLDINNMHLNGTKKEFVVTCRDCGASWTDYEE